MNRRVVVTGMGVVSSLGCQINSFFENISNGVSGISPIKSFDTSNHSVKIAGEVTIDLNDYFNKKEVNLMRISTLEAKDVENLKSEVSKNINLSSEKFIDLLISPTVDSLETRST